jgi:hypothetical protein
MLCGWLKGYDDGGNEGGKVCFVLDIKEGKILGVKDGTELTNIVGDVDGPALILGTLLGVNDGTELTNIVGDVDGPALILGTLLGVKDGTELTNIVGDFDGPALILGTMLGVKDGTERTKTVGDVDGPALILGTLLGYNEVQKLTLNNGAELIRTVGDVEGLALILGLILGETVGALVGNAVGKPATLIDFGKFEMFDGESIRDDESRVLGVMIDAKELKGAKDVEGATLMLGLLLVETEGAISSSESSTHATTESASKSTGNFMSGYGVYDSFCRTISLVVWFLASGVEILSTMLVFLSIQVKLNPSVVKLFPRYDTLLIVIFRVYSLKRKLSIAMLVSFLASRNEILSTVLVFMSLQVILNSSVVKLFSR